MSPAVKRIILQGGGFNPYALPNLAARYSLDGGESDSTYLTNGLGRVRLIADRSGNSAEKCLVVNGVVGNNATVPELTAFGTGNFSVSVRLQVTSLAAQGYAISGEANSFGFAVNTNGTLVSAKPGVAFNTASTGAIALFGETVISYVRSGTTGTYYIAGIAAGTTTDNRDYTVGINRVGASGSGTGPITALIYRARVYPSALDASQIAADAAGTVQSGCIFDADFTRPAKLAGTFTESSVNAATVTINASGDLGARICGARDLYQATTTKMALLSTGADGRPLATFDGSNDYMKVAPFSLSQPETVYFVGSQVTWTINDMIFDGNASDSMAFQQRTATPEVRQYAGNYTDAQTDWAVGTTAVLSLVYNAASSTSRVNRRPSVNGNASTANAGGFTVGAVGGANVAFANITFNEADIFAAAHADSTQLRVAGALMRKWGVPA
jgi:hypothetical protein